MSLKDLKQDIQKVVTKIKQQLITLGCTEQELSEATINYCNQVTKQDFKYWIFDYDDSGGQQFEETSNLRPQNFVQHIRPRSDS